MLPLQITEQRVALDGAALFVRRIAPAATPAASDAPTLVFLHDSLGCVATWRDFPEQVVRRVGLPALNYDRQGYGQSSSFSGARRTITYLDEEAAVLFQLLDALAIERVVLFGHSDGASVALLAATQQPERVTAVISEAAHVFVEDVSLAGIRAAQEALATTDLPQRLARYHGDKVAGVTSAWIDTWLQPEFRSWNIVAQLTAIACPVLAMQGEDDEFGTPAQVRAIVDGVGARAESLMIPGIGHTAHRDARDLVLNATATFIAAALASR